MEILRLARGPSNRQIGQELFISEHTAANHIRRILRKTDCANRTEAAAYAHRRGLVGTDRRGTIGPMPLYVIERTFAEQLDLTADDVRLIEDVNADEGVSWLFSFLSADRQRTYCLYEAPSPDAIVAAARRANVPVDTSSRSASSFRPRSSGSERGRLVRWDPLTGEQREVRELVRTLARERIAPRAAEIDEIARVPVGRRGALSRARDLRAVLRTRSTAAPARGRCSRWSRSRRSRRSAPRAG